MTTPTSPTPAAGPWLYRWLSRPRFAAYLATCGGDAKAALRLYEWNSTISAALQRDLGHLEVGLRNACDAALTRSWCARHHRGHWLVDPCSPVLAPLRVQRRGGQVVDLNTTARSKVETAIRTAGGPDVPIGKMIAELNFAFWVHLHDAHHEKTIWVPHLFRAYPTGSARHVVHRLLERMRLLRNRVAHLEPVYGLPLAVRHQELVRICGWLGPELGDYVAITSTVPELLAMWPTSAP